MDEFVLWMQGLDAEKVASKESFHSQNHRDWMNLHEMEKTRIASAVSRVAQLERHLVRISEFWLRKEQRAGAVENTLKERISANPVAVFTETQLNIAIQSTRKGK